MIHDIWIEKRFQKSGPPCLTRRAVKLMDGSAAKPRI
jgi:hypothetical protein